MFEQINQPIEVTASFSENKLIPRRFIWPASPKTRLDPIESERAASRGGHGREIEIIRVNLTYHVWEGRSKIYYFAVSDNVNDFKLRFDTDKLSWMLLEVYAE